MGLFHPHMGGYYVRQKDTDAEALETEEQPRAPECWRWGEGGRFGVGKFKPWVKGQATGAKRKMVQKLSHHFHNQEKEKGQV